MTYNVIGENGAEYGPATIDLLRQWVVEGRLTQHDHLRNLETGAIVPASSIPELFVGTFAQPPPPAGYANYYRAGPQWAGMDIGTNDLIAAWVIGILGFCFCPIIFCPLSMFFGYRAHRKGNRGGMIAFWVILGLGILALGISLWSTPFLNGRL